MIWGLWHWTLPRSEGMEETLDVTPSRIFQQFSGKGKPHRMRQPSNYFKPMSNYFCKQYLKIILLLYIYENIQLYKE